METIDINGRTCHIIINGVEFPMVYLGEMRNSSETIEKVLALCGDAKCNYIIYEAEEWNTDFSPWKFMLNKKCSSLAGDENVGRCKLLL